MFVIIGLRDYSCRHISYIVNCLLTKSLCTIFSSLTRNPYFKVFLLSIQFNLKYNFSDWQFIRKKKCSFFKKLGKQNNLLAVQKHCWHYPVSQEYVVYHLLKCESEHSWQVNEEIEIKISAQTKAALIIQVNKICIQKKTVKVIENVSVSTGHLGNRKMSWGLNVLHFT